MEIIERFPRRALVVIPHPDDGEGGCGGTIGRWIKEAGTHVVCVLCTNGDKGTSDRDMAPATLAAIREREQQEASAVLGVQQVVLLSHPDGGVEDSRLFRGQLVREIRRHRPEVVFCIDPYRSVSHTHRDHRMTGQVALDAAFSYAWSYLHFPEQLAQEGLTPHQVSEAYLWGSEAPDVFVDISGYLDLKAESLSKHYSQMGHRPPDSTKNRIMEGAARQGETVGLPYAEGFRRLRFEPGSVAWRLLNT
jgi:LmbE family N-acetylglucosaminyl deacetylase